MGMQWLETGGREQGKGRGRASLVATLWAQAWVLSFPRVGSKWVTHLPFSYTPALATGRPWCENHDEHLDASEGLSPDNHHSEREERTREARALRDRPGRRPRNWVTFTERNSFCCLGNICLVGWTLIFEIVPLSLLLKYFNQIYISYEFDLYTTIYSKGWSWYIIILTFSWFVVRYDGNFQLLAWNQLQYKHLPLNYNSPWHLGWS